MAPLSSSPTLTLVNLTCTSLHLRHPFASSSLPLAAGSTISAAHHATVDDHGLLYILAEATSTNGFKGKHRSLDSFSTANEDEIPVQLKLGRCEARTLLFETSEEAPFRVWQQRAKGKQYTLIFVPRVDTARWMASLPDETPLSSLYIPGTHESLAFYGGPISTCQTSRLPIRSQLVKGGVRFLDYRFSLKGGGLKAYHGIQNEYVAAEEAFEYVYRFLEGEGKGEAVIISVKQENATPAFEAALNELLEKRRDLWYREDRWPTLGEVRGRAVMFCRFGFESSPNGLHPPVWPNNSTEAFATSIGGQDCVIQDWYSIGSFLRIPEKAALVLSLLRPPPRSSSPPSASPPASLPSFDRRPFRISFLSGATFLVAFPYLVAKGLGYPAVSSLTGFPGVNQRVLDGLLARGALGEEPGWSDGGKGNFGNEDYGKSDAATKEKRLAPQVENAEGGMILLTDFWEFPGGLNELFIAWNMVQR